MTSLAPQRSMRDMLRAVLARVCQRVDLDAGGAELIRLVNNAVFRLARHPVVVRISLTSGLAHRAHSAVTAARLLAVQGIPAVRLVPGIAQPVHFGGHAATFWQLVSQAPAPPTAAELGALLTRMHRLPVAGCALPPWDPIADLRSRIAAARCWAPGDADLLARHCDAVEVKLHALDYRFPAAMIHGDAHLGNLIKSPQGAILCDLDTTCIGPAEWDLVPVAVAHHRFTRAVNTHRQLAEAYGFDITGWEGFAVLREIRELKLAAVGLPLALDSPAASRELRRRLDTIRTNDTTTYWNPYR